MKLATISFECLVTSKTVIPLSFLHTTDIAMLIRTQVPLWAPINNRLSGAQLIGTALVDSQFAAFDLHLKAEQKKNETCRKWESHIQVCNEPKSNHEKMSWCIPVEVNPFTRQGDPLEKVKHPQFCQGPLQSLSYIHNLKQPGRAAAAAAADSVVLKESLKSTRNYISFRKPWVFTV